VRTDTDQFFTHTSYAFDVEKRFEEHFLMNRRLFAFADSGAPDGIKCDMAGNVYSGCCEGDGVHVWSPGGVLLGKILAEGGVANFFFGRNGEMFLMNETRLWRAKLAKTTRGALLGI
jgi:gluconolactonase